MKYSQETLRNAIYLVMPGFKTAIDRGCSMNLPTMLRDSAIECFVRQNYINPGTTKTRPLDEMIAEMIIRLALKDLRELGQFEFGTIEYKFQSGEEND